MPNSEIPPSGHILWPAPPPLSDPANIPAHFRASTTLVRTKYRHLYELPVVEYSSGSRSFHDAWLYRCHGLNVLFLRGDFVEMAFQHGRLLADQIPQGTLPQSAKLVRNAIANAIGRRQGLPQRLMDYVEGFLVRRMFIASSKLISGTLGDDYTLLESIALCDAAGLSVSDLIQSLFNPEILLILANHGGGARRSKAEQIDGVCVPPASCCSSFAAWGSHTADGRLLIGHNMDYPLNGYYDRFPTVIYFEPTVPSQRYMSFVSAGVQSAGITSYNEAGIFLAAHVVPTSDASFKGAPALMTANLAIRRATSFNSAVDVFRQVPPPAGWTYLVGSVPERKVASLEMSNGHFAIRPAEGEFLVQTNHFLTPEMRGLNLFLNKSVDEDSAARFARVRQRLQDASGRLDTSEAISILGDQVDPLVNQVRGLGNTVGVHTTLGSVVLDPTGKRVLVSAGSAPASHSDFIELPLIGTFDRADFPTFTCRVIRDPGFRDAHPEKLAALQVFIQAKSAYENHNDHTRAYQLLQEVVRQDPSNPAYYFQLGIFALKIELYDNAVGAFDAVFRCPYLPAQLRRLALYYRGRTHVLLRQFEDAQEDFAAVIADSQCDQKLRTAAQKAARRTRLFRCFSLKKRSLNIMMQQSDMLNY